jgi:two-component system sensor histidine kinase TctE
MMALVAVMVWIALRWGLRSLVRLGDLVRSREPGSLEPLDPGPVPQELQPLVSAQNDYIQRLDALLAARNRFIANASHQLRTPLTVLQTQADFGLSSPDPAQKDEVLKAISQGVRDGTRLVNQLLSLSVAEAGAQHPVPRAAVDAADLVQRVLEEHAALAQARDIDLGFEVRGERMVLLTSEAMLRELVANLVDNALRYAPAHGVVTASVHYGPGRVRLRVEDNGPGIPAEDRERVFKRFVRLRPGETSGSGLGLAIVRELAAALGAGVQLEDPDQGPGLVVTVSLPA